MPSDTAHTLSDDSNREFNLRILKILAFHDAFVAALLVTTFLILYTPLGVIILLLPVLEYSYFLAISSPINNEAKAAISRFVPDTKNVRFRSIGRKASQAFTLPGFKMVCLSDDVLNSATAKNADTYKQVAQGIIAHEVGHTRQFDRIVFRWLQAIFLIAILVAAFAIIYIAAVYAGLLQNDDIRQLEVFLFVVILTAIGFLYLTISRVAHRREFIADIIGYKQYGPSFMQFIEDSLRIEGRLNKSKQKNERRNSYYHPTFADRKNVLIGQLPVAALKIRSLSAQWFIIAALLVPPLVALASLQDNFLIFALVVGSVSYWAYFAFLSIRHNSVRTKEIAVEYSRGMMNGALMILAYALGGYLIAVLAGEDFERLRLVSLLSSALILILFLPVFHFIGILLLNLRTNFRSP